MDTINAFLGAVLRALAPQDALYCALHDALRNVVPTSISDLVLNYVRAQIVLLYDPSMPMCVKLSFFGTPHAIYLMADDRQLAVLSTVSLYVRRYRSWDTKLSKFPQLFCKYVDKITKLVYRRSYLSHTRTNMTPHVRVFKPDHPADAFTKSQCLVPCDYCRQLFPANQGIFSATEESFTCLAHGVLPQVVEEATNQFLPKNSSENSSKRSLQLRTFEQTDGSLSGPIRLSPQKLKYGGVRNSNLGVV